MNTISTEYGQWELFNNNDGNWMALSVGGVNAPTFEGSTVGSVSFQVHNWKPKEQPEDVLSPIKSTGGSSSYYRFPIKSSITGQTMEVETGDVIRAMVGNDFDLGNIIKACRRISQAEQGKGKEGTDVVYDCNKIAYFAEQKKKEQEGK